MRPYLTRELAIEALRRALELREPPPGLIQHTDRGSQYASRDYRAMLDAAKVRPSMSRRGNCLDCDDCLAVPSTSARVTVVAA